MRILQCNTERTWRGGERQTLFLATALARLGPEVEILCLEGTPLHQRAAERGLPVHPVSGSAATMRFLATRGSHYDILHAQTAKAQSQAVLTRFLHHKPIVYTRRVDFVPKGLGTRLKYRATDKVVAISNAIAAILHDFGVVDVPVLPSVLEPYELDQNAVISLRMALQLPADKRVLGTVGSLVPHKDPLTMVKAVAALKKLRGDDFTFIHLGDGPLLPAVQSEIARYNLQSCYLLPGHVPDIAPYMGLFEVFAMSSIEEGLGSTVLDAFLLSIPVASTSAGGLAECVGDRGLLSEPLDAQALASNIQHLLEDVALRSSFTARARDYVLLTHQPQRSARNYLDIFASLLNT